MNPLRPLPPPPRIAVAIASEQPDPRATGGFVNLRRLRLRLDYPDGTRSEEFAYDIATRASLDAVVFAAHFRAGGERQVFLRSCVRPPLALRTTPPHHDATLWELPAGLVDPGESPREAAAREIDEELGFRIEPDALRELGPSVAPTPALIGELHIFFHVEVDPASRRLPSEDGSPLERAAAVVSLPLSAALEHCRRGAILDSKTELALRRLAELP